MYSNYLTALEMRMKWLKWAKDKAYEFYKGVDALEALPMYEYILSSGDTFFMNRTFCQSVDFARRTLPDDLEFDPAWMVSKVGWMWLEEPFQCPPLNGPKLKGGELSEVESGLLSKLDSRLRISAIAWYPIDSGIVTEGINGHPGRMIGEGAYEFVCFHDLRLLNDKVEGFGCWSYFSLMPGDKVLDRIRIFERVACDYFGRSNSVTEGAYLPGRELDTLHEARWVYTALYMMSQKLAMTVEHRPERQARKRVEKETTLVPMIRVVTLRRMEEDRKKDPKGNAVDWQWQWKVHHFWRRQWYPSEGVHKPVWIEDYIKGPIDRPLKPDTHTVYVARR